MSAQFNDVMVKTICDAFQTYLENSTRSDKSIPTEVLFDISDFISDFITPVDKYAEHAYLLDFIEKLTNLLYDKTKVIKNIEDNDRDQLLAHCRSLRKSLKGFIVSAHKTPHVDLESR